MKLSFLLLGLLIVMPLSAQEGGLLDWDIADIFYLPLPEAPAEEPEDAEVFSPMALLRPRGFVLDGSFEFTTGFVPGWQVPPWFYTEDSEAEDSFSWGPVARMRARFDLDAQVSEFLRIRTSVFFMIPGLDIELREFFFDYNLFNRIFIRGGRFNQTWGASPNFPFANLLARLPDDTPTGDPFILRADIPVGIGGFQFLALTRRELLAGEPVRLEDVGYGGRFNLALRWVDINIGAFYQSIMPLRGFLSINTTIGRTEWYNEWLGAVDLEHSHNLGGAVSVGFVRDFFRNRLTVNGELFFNTEQNTFWHRPETNITEAETLSFNYGLNIAFNLIYRLGGRTGPRLFVQTSYAPLQGSAQLVPGFRLTPLQHLEFYFAVPMSLGNRSGQYFIQTADPIANRPFAIVMLLTLRGTIRVGQNH